MGELLGSTMESDDFIKFLELTIRGYLAVRKYWKELFALISVMSDSGLPCFLKTTLSLLKKRFHPEMNDVEAANFMFQTVINFN